MSQARQYHTATLLPDGKVLVVGGERGDIGVRGTAEIYDPSTDIWTPTEMTNLARTSHTATLLPDGKVLIAGGLNGNVDSAPATTAEIYDPSSDTWTLTARMHYPRIAGHATALLETGKILVAGGGYQDPTAELYDPDTGVWTLTGSMRVPGDHLAMTTLPDGKVLVAGHSTDTAQFYDPASGAWTLTGATNYGHPYPALTRLLDGKILITGGPTRTVELYDPSTNSWALGGNLHAMPITRHAATRLENGRVLIAGNALASELYNP
jgi:WD40 repeat protein